jgi:hypothetical protein
MDRLSFASSWSCPEHCAMSKKQKSVVPYSNIRLCPISGTAFEKHGPRHCKEWRSYYFLPFLGLTWLDSCRLATLPRSFTAHTFVSLLEFHGNHWREPWTNRFIWVIASSTAPKFQTTLDAEPRHSMRSMQPPLFRWTTMSQYSRVWRWCVTEMMVSLPNSWPQLGDCICWRRHLALHGTTMRLSTESKPDSMKAKGPWHLSPLPRAAKSSCVQQSSTNDCAGDENQIQSKTMETCRSPVTALQERLWMVTP